MAEARIINLPVRQNITTQDTQEERLKVVRALRLKLKSQRFPYGEIGSTGTENIGGFLHSEEYNQALQGLNGIRIYDQMRRSDSQVQATLMVITLPIVSATWKIQPASKSPKDVQIADFVRRCYFEHSEIPWKRHLTEALLHLTFGYMAFEKVYKYSMKERKIILSKLAPRLPKTIYRWVQYETGELDSIIQFAWFPRVGPAKSMVAGNQYSNLNDMVWGSEASGAWKYVKIDGEKLVLFVHNQEGDNFEGMALDLNTLIPTPLGWKTMADLHPGDPVFDERGKTCYVTAEKTWENRPTYDITFSNGQVITADANHLWEVDEYTWGLRKKRRVVTTQEMFENPVCRNGNRKPIAKWSINLTKPLEYAPQHLLIDPYVMGWWLSDGTSSCAEITSKDQQTRGLLRRCGYRLSEKKMDREHAQTYRLYDNMQLQLRVLGLINNKHIPEQYLVGSIDQRMALVQGLMDGDGTVDAYGSCEFSNSNKDIVDGFVELLLSLGCKAILQPDKPEFDSYGWKSMYRIRFQPQFPVFRLTRKLKRQRVPGKRSLSLKVWDVRPSGKRTTKCIEVDSASNLFLCGVSCIPTHNSVLRPAYQNWYYKTLLYKIDAMKHDRYGSGIPVVKMPLGAGDDDVETAIEVASSIRSHEKAFAVLPPGYELEILGMGSSLGSDVMGSITHHNEAISGSVLAQYMDLGKRGVGSNSQSTNMSDILFLSEQSTADNMQSVHNKEVIPELVDINFEKPDEYPKLDVGDIRPLDYAAVSAALTQLATAKIVTPGPETEEWVRQEFGFPEVPNLPTAQERLTPLAPVGPDGQIPQRGFLPGNGTRKPQPRGTVRAREVGLKRKYRYATLVR